METQEFYNSDWNYKDFTIKTADTNIFLSECKPDYSFVFSNPEMKEIGRFDFNGDKMVFTGDTDGSAKLFVDTVAYYFQKRLIDEYNKGIERAITIAENYVGGLNERSVSTVLDAIRKEIK